MDKALDVYSELKFGNGQAVSADFIGRGNIWINNTYDRQVIQLAQYIIYESITKTAMGQLSILGYDSDLSGVLAPFSSLSAGDNRQMELTFDEKEFETHLKYLRQQIQAVQNVIQGRRKSLIEFRELIQRPIEGYKLIVLSLDMGMIDQKIRAELSTLMRSGPACGISFLIISTTFMSIQTQSGKDIELSVDAIASNITVLEADGYTVTLKDKKISYTPITAECIIQRCEMLAKDVRNVQLPIVRFEEIHNISDIWTYESTDGLTFSIGKYGIDNMEMTIGDEINQRHNILITGAVGQGKSNLIAVIIHSLCLRYSPEELQLYLLDFKEGVTFKLYSDIGQDEYLPHARALGLESDVSFGIAVLEFLYSEYQRRMRILKDNNSRSIRELRRQNPGMKIPRIVAVIDEFQMMFGDDAQTGQKVADLLEKSVRLFRAAGIHFILASQTLGENMVLGQKRDSIFSQIPIRIALKNSVSESQKTLALNNSAAAFLRPREAIVNLDYGVVSQNKKTIIAFADEELLRPLRKIWWDKVKFVTSAPYVFESERRLTVSSGIESIRVFRRKGLFPVAIVGNRISVNSEHVILPLSEEPGRNIAVIGTPDSDCNQAIGIMQSIAVSVAIQNPKGNARFLFCDFAEKGISYGQHYPDFAQLMENTGYFIENIKPEHFEDTIKGLLEQEISEDRIYVFASSLDKWEYEKDPYGQGTVLKNFVEVAPSKNMHFIGWWMKASSFTSQVAGYGSTDAFNSKIFLRLDERAVQSLTNPFVRWTSQNNRALVSDSIEFAEEMPFIPYAPVLRNDVSVFKAQVWN